jgi:hypothetical protein
MTIAKSQHSLFSFSRSTKHVADDHILAGGADPSRHTDHIYSIVDFLGCG